MLEIGAGTGATTGAVLAGLDPMRSTFTFTDVSDFFLGRAAQRFAARTNVGYLRLDIEQDAGSQGVAPGSIDVVVAANVMHATRHLDAALANARAALRPGGLLVMYEATTHPRWFDVSTGLIEGWQRFADAWRTDQPLLDVATWRAALAAAGFVDVLAVPGPELPTDVLGQHVLVARASDDGPTPDRPVAVVEAVDGRALAGTGIVLPTAAELLAELDAALPDERSAVLVGVVRRAVAGVLRAADAERLDARRPLLDLGFDSLMAIELRNVLRGIVGRPVPATVVFDHPNITALAGYLGSMVTGAPADPASVTTRALMPTATSSATLAALSDDEVERMLIDKLAEL